MKFDQGMTNRAWRQWAKAQPPYLGGRKVVRFNPRLDARIIAAIRADHLKANIGRFEEDREASIVHWHEAWIDPGGTIFGPGDPPCPYLKVPVSSRLWSDEKLPHRVYAPARLRRRLAQWVGEWKGRA